MNVFVSRSQHSRRSSMPAPQSDETRKTIVLVMGVLSLYFFIMTGVCNVPWGIRSLNATVQSAHIGEYHEWASSKATYWEHVTFPTHASGPEDGVSWCMFDGERTDKMDLDGFQAYIQIQWPVGKEVPMFLTRAEADGNPRCAKTYPVRWFWFWVTIYGLAVLIAIVYETRRTIIQWRARSRDSNTPMVAQPPPSQQPVQQPQQPAAPLPPRINLGRAHRYAEVPQREEAVAPVLQWCNVSIGIASSRKLTDPHRLQRNIQLAVALFDTYRCIRRFKTF
jgi:hypothetical protein